MKIIAMLLLLCVPAFAKDHAYQNGKLLSVSKEGDGTVVGTSASNIGMAFAQSHAIFVIQVADLVYTVRGERVNQRTRDYSKGLIVGDPVKAAVEGNTLVLLLPNGKDFGTAILTRERANQ
jgi:hypothetical protein